MRKSDGYPVTLALELKTAAGWILETSAAVVRYQAEKNIPRTIGAIDELTMASERFLIVINTIGEIARIDQAAARPHWSVDDLEGLMEDTTDLDIDPRYLCQN